MPKCCSREGEECGVWVVSGNPPRHCEKLLRRSNPDCVRGLLDCFAEPLIGRAFARRVGSQ